MLRFRSRSPPQFERPRGSRDRDNRSQRDVYKEREMEDEEKERKRAERKALDKEVVYQVTFSDLAMDLCSNLTPPRLMPFCTGCGCTVRSFIQFLPDPRAVQAGSAAQLGPTPQPAGSNVKLDAEESSSDMLTIASFVDLDF